MWPERLLQVAQNIRGMVDDSGMAEFFQLARSYDIKSLEELETYDYQYRLALGALIRSMTGLLDAADSLSVPLGDIHEGVLKAKNRLSSISEKLESTEPFTKSLVSRQPEIREQNISNLPVFDFIPLSKTSDLGTTTSRLMMAVEEEDAGKALKYLGLYDQVASDLLELWEFRTPEGLGQKDQHKETALRSLDLTDLDVGRNLTSLRSLRHGDKREYQKLIAMLVHAAIEEARGVEAAISLDEFYDRLSPVSLFIDVGFNDVMFSFAELLERGWIGGMQDRRGRQVLELRWPNVEHLAEELGKEVAGMEVTTEKVMEEMGWDYFTALHIIKRLEKRGDLATDDGLKAGCLWHWKGDKKKLN